MKKHEKNFNKFYLIKRNDFEHAYLLCLYETTNGLCHKEIHKSKVVKCKDIKTALSLPNVTVCNFYEQYDNCVVSIPMKDKADVFYNFTIYEGHDYKIFYYTEELTGKYKNYLTNFTITQYKHINNANFEKEVLGKNPLDYALEQDAKEQ